jgi:hypothetical protein
LASSESQTADVECFASATSTVPLDHSACMKVPALALLTAVTHMSHSLDRKIPGPVSSVGSLFPLQCHSQYVCLLYPANDVLIAFSVWGFLVLLLLMAVRQHFLGETVVWYCPVTSYPWFNKYTKHSPKLPSPVTSRRQGGLSRGRSYNEKDYYAYSGKDRYTARNSPRQGERGRTEWREQKAPAKAHVSERRERHVYPTHAHDKFARGASPRR